jgi:LTXXQ motif family protein
MERRQQAVQQRQQNLRARSTAPASAGNAVSPRQQTVQNPRLQQLQSKSRLSSADRRELRTFQRSERQNAQRNNLQPQNAQTAQQDRLQQLQLKGRLSRTERRELRTLQQSERQNTRQQQQQNTAAAAAPIQNQQPRGLRTQAVTAHRAEQGRFASGLRTHATGPGSRFAGRRAARLAARTAWQLGLLAPYVPWRGPVYYPYAYNDIFYYTFWPEAYDPGYWAYAYDDLFDGVYFPDGAPYAEYAAEGPYAGPDGRVTTGSAPSRPAAPGRVTQATRDFCAEQAKGVTAWPLEQIAAAVQPTEDQKALLANLQKAAEDAAARFRDACPDAVPMTPPGRMQVMLLRLQAIDEAIQTVKPALQPFYNSLNDEQKARFNEIGQQLGQPRQQRNASGNTQAGAANCSADKAGISDLAINRIEEIVRPTDAQGAALDKLDAAMQKAIERLREACPNTIPQTPVGRLDVMQKRVEAMIDAANTVRPALDEFYASLNDEQKAKFNRLGREHAQQGG